jgi:hypothetical protein
MVLERDIDTVRAASKGKKMNKNLKIFMILIPILSVLSHPGIPAESLPRFEQPILLTSVGQSADVQIGSVLFKKAGLASVLLKNATYQDLGDKKTLALVMGVSMKGLGAAGLDIEQEKMRVKELIGEAQKREIPILCLHLGGEARRGELSDQMIRNFLPHAKMAVVVKSGNADGLFTEICAEHNIPLVEAEKTVDVQNPLKDIFVLN